MSCGKGTKTVARCGIVILNCVALCPLAQVPSLAQAPQGVLDARPESPAGRNSTGKRAVFAMKRRGGQRQVAKGESLANGVTASLPADLVARKARVTFRNGMMQIEADNADLCQILVEMSALSGMTLNGLNGGPRIFGVYGPGNLTDVLRALLLGTGYNYILVGGNGNQIPRELVLSRESDSTQEDAEQKAKFRSTPQAVAAGQDPPEMPVDASAEAPLGPGAVPTSSSQDDQESAVRIQQHLRRLEQEQEQQQKPPQ